MHGTTITHEVIGVHSRRARLPEAGLARVPA